MGTDNLAAFFVICTKIAKTGNENNVTKTVTNWCNKKLLQNHVTKIM